MSVKYTYTKEAVLGRLELEIRASSIITIALDYMTSLGNVIDIYFKAALSAPEITGLDAIVAAHVPTPLPSEAMLVDVLGGKSNEGNLIVERGLATGKAGTRGVSIVTPDLSDRTTWYQKSIQVVAEVLSDSGDGLTFTSDHPHWINIYSLRLTYTHKQIPKRDGTWGKHSDWKTIVYIDGVEVTSGFTIDFSLGTVTFAASQAGKTVTCTYWHNDGVALCSEWLLVPLSGKKLLVDHTELQISVGIGINDTLRFEIWAGANLATYGTFPDYLFEAGYGQMQADYRSANDFINAANLGQGVVAKFGDLTKEVIIMPFNYLQAFCLDSKYGSIFRLLMRHDLPYTSADIATGTFYIQISESS